MTENSTLFLAGAAGAIGFPLSRMLVDDGWRVVGMTRSVERAEALVKIGVEAVIVDVYDMEALRRSMRYARPGVVIHQLTDLPPALAADQMAEGRRRNARIRDVGTRNLIAAAVAAGATRMIAQSIAFAYRKDSPPPHREDAPLVSEALAAFERQVLAGPLKGTILRYGHLYGPGTGFESRTEPGALHVDAAADAARQALTLGSPGVYNVAEAGGPVDSGKAAAELGWSADFRLE
jgi:nucleoside-diphosphate-sugar epimerase